MAWVTESLDAPWCTRQKKSNLVYST
jgi:hypothetical protein